MDFLRGILKWIILGVLFIVIIVLIVKMSTRTEKKTTKTEPPTSIVDFEPGDGGSDGDIIEESLEEEPLTVDSPDTASTAFPQVAVGLIILTLGGRYIYKNRNVKGNS